MRAYCTRLAALTTVGLLLALGCVGEAIQSAHIYGRGGQDLLQTIAASAYVNVLLGSACVTYIISRTIYAIVRPGAQSNRPTHAARVVCLASEEDIAALQFRDMCRLQSVRASMCVDHNQTPRIAYLTPAWLWYYLYTVGVGVFVMGYTLSGGHDVASGTMSLSLSVCAVAVSLHEAVHSGSLRDTAARAAGALLLLPAAVLVVVRPYKTAAIESVALGIVLPALAPPFLCVAGRRIVSSHLRPDAAVAFALPFVMALSMCYLSVYTPMRAAWIESQVFSTVTL